MKTLYILILMAMLCCACAKQSTDTVSMNLPTPASGKATAAPGQPGAQPTDTRQAATDLPRPTATHEPSPTAQPTPTGLQATISEVINDVSAHPLPDQAWQQALVEMIIHIGGEVWAKEASTARIALGNSVLRVAPNTVFSHIQPDEVTTHIDLEQGRLWLNVEGLQASQGETFEVQTPTAIAGVRGTRFSVQVTEDGTTVVSSMEGAVTLTGAGVTITVTAGTQSTVFPALPPSTPVSITLAERGSWGMAYGPNLDIQLPLTDPITHTVRGKVFDTTWSHDGSTFGYTLYDDSLGGDSEVIFYNPLTLSRVDWGVPHTTWYHAFNPARQGLAYLQTGASGAELCVVESPGAEANCFLSTSGSVGRPHWSPDGNWILLYSEMLASGSQRPALAGARLGLGSLPALDSGRLRLPWLAAQAYNLFIVRPDGSGLLALARAENGLSAIRPAWSPDSVQVTYVMAADYSMPGEAWVVNADGSDPHPIAAVDAGSSSPAWSPDGEWLALQPPGEPLWLVHPDSSAAHAIPGLPAGKYREIRWSPTPTGWPLVFMYADETSPYQMYILPSEGAEPQPVNLGNWAPLWSPDGSRVALQSYSFGGEKQDFIWFEMVFYTVQTSFWTAK